MFKLTSSFISARQFSTSSALQGQIAAPPLVYIAGEEMTRYAGELYLQKWIRPFVDTSKWQFFDLSCKSRDDTNDQVLKDCIAAGKQIGAIYKGMCFKKKKKINKKKLIKKNN